jgi:hypothetical protein
LPLPQLHCLAGLNLTKEWRPSEIELVK